jgi:hypothetical protein
MLAIQVCQLKIDQCKDKTTHSHLPSEIKNLYSVPKCNLFPFLVIIVLSWLSSHCKGRFCHMNIVLDTIWGIYLTYWTLCKLDPSSGIRRQRIHSDGAQRKGYSWSLVQPQCCTHVMNKATVNDLGRKMRIMCYLLPHLLLKWSCHIFYWPL